MSEACSRPASSCVAPTSSCIRPLERANLSHPRKSWQPSGLGGRDGFGGRDGEVNGRSAEPRRAGHRIKRRQRGGLRSDRRAALWCCARVACEAYVYIYALRLASLCQASGCIRHQAFVFLNHAGNRPRNNTQHTQYIYIYIYIHIYIYKHIHIYIYIYI